MPDVSVCAARFWRVIVTGVRNGGNQIQLRDIFFSTISGSIIQSAYEVVTLSVGSLSSLTNNIYNSSSEDVNIDGVTSGGAIFSWTFDSQIMPVSVSMAQSDSPERYPDDFTIYKSDNGTSLTPVSTKTNWAPGTGIGALYTYSFSVSCN